MRLDDQRESDQIDDRRGSGGGGIFSGGRLGIVGMLAVLAISYFTGISPSTLMGLVGGNNNTVEQPNRPPPANDPTSSFVARVLGSTEDIWTEEFQKLGRTYQKPILTLFSGATQTACGQGQAAMGPFYCSNDHHVYIDLDFFHELETRFGGGGEFAEAYVIAHEVGHHVQNLLGISDKVHAAQERSSKAQGNALSVRLELQADCLAGVWGRQADVLKHQLEPGEAEQALRAASAIGDDTLQKQTQGYVVPESFTHGTSEQRMQWFNKGFQSGDMSQCNTFRKGA
ncbi:membrane protein [Novimethylophilus kurashikiensis]|uniref:Membrane protein n=1 Tax=Novimethylophilus kurashikiensis TaxID=1825523 RepID=A0A2R5F636_9PROT|nr:neutral zinc metallopeptidase [Novimethylophilus kurashikiensis]GBG13585.1 membrane protein [Novimethylophilus kurashikiensis]